MSGSSSAAAVTVAVDGLRPLFTPVQWQELEHQALIYKYLIAGVPVPSELVVPIRRSLEALPTRFLHHSACKNGNWMYIHISALYFCHMPAIFVLKLSCFFLYVYKILVQQFASLINCTYNNQVLIDN